MKSLKGLAHDLLAISLSPKQTEAFDLYSDELARWNQRISLTAIRDPEEVKVKHFLDSLSCWIAMREQAHERVIDVGSGAGFPGLPLKILAPQISLTMVESVGKKVAFLEHMVQVLGLDGVSIVASRAEELGQNTGYREQYDWAIARAVASLPALAELLLPFVKQGGFMLAQKGNTAEEEMLEAGRAFSILGGDHPKLIEIELPGVRGARYLVVSGKTGKTEKKYPRRVGIPAKRPL